MEILFDWHVLGSCSGPSGPDTPCVLINTVEEEIVSFLDMVVDYRFFSIKGGFKQFFFCLAFAFRSPDILVVWIRK
jgi:hypothetical protein